MIAETLEYLFPDIDFERECLLEDDGKGPRIAKWLRAEKQPTIKELEAVWPAVQASLETKALERKLANDAQKAGIDAAKLAYSRMQTIINNADTATLAQLRLAIKEIAKDMQHLIRAAVR